MYRDPVHQITQLMRFATAGIGLYVIAPRLIWPGLPGDHIDRFWQGLTRMVAFTIALVYCLVLSSLYEVLGLAFCIVLYLLWRCPDPVQRRQLWQRTAGRVCTGLYDLLDGLIRPAQRIRQLLRTATISMAAGCKSRLRHPANTAADLLGLIVLGYSAWLRFQDAVLHAAPAMSDAYVTLAWMKYIERRVVFHDGIYPQGFHIVLSTLHKFAGQDALYTLKYAGPLCGVLTVFGIYYTTWKLTGRKTAGAFAALVYGALGAWLPLEWQRQASTNSQEFALIFVVPTWYWSHRFLMDGRRSDWWSAFASCLIVGWVHTLAYLFLVLGLACLGLTHLLTRWRAAWRHAPALIGAGAISACLAALPMGIGILLGREFHQTSLQFATSSLTMSQPAVTWVDCLPIVGVALFLLLALLRKERQLIVTAVLLVVLTGTAFGFYRWAGPLSGNAVLATRSNLLWSLVSALDFGVTWAAICSLIDCRSQRLCMMEVSATTLVCCLALAILQPQPPEPYKMQPDNMVEQYLRISSEFRPTEWMIVSADEGYALALGQGYHMHLGDWLRSYSATGERLRSETTAGQEVMLTPHIFLFREKVVFWADFDHLTALYQQRTDEYLQLERWLREYGSAHDNLSLFYEDDTLEIWRINQTDLLESRRIRAGRSP